MDKPKDFCLARVVRLSIGPKKRSTDVTRSEVYEEAQAEWDVPLHIYMYLTIPHIFVKFQTKIWSRDYAKTTLMVSDRNCTFVNCCR